MMDGEKAHSRKQLTIISLQSISDSSETKNKHLKEEFQSLDFCKLPGQIFSESDSNEATTQQEKSKQFQNILGQKLTDGESQSSVDEFDMHKFRTLNLQKNVSQIPIGNNDNNNNNINNNYSNKIIKQLSIGQKKYIYILGLKFEIAILQERNKDPILFLKTLSMCCLFLSLVQTVMFVVGLNFRLFPTFLTFIDQIIGTTIVIVLTQSSIKNGVQIKLKAHFLSAIMMIIFAALFVYCYLVQMPFNSQPIFLLLNYIVLIIICFLTACNLIPNSTPFDDPNYQLKFFSTRIMAGFFNGTGWIDVLSDIVLGIQLIQYPSKKFLIIGILLFILCNIDYLFVAKRVLAPQKITIPEQLLVLLFELIVLTLTIIVLFDAQKVSKDEENDDFLFVTVISITTTIINFSHNIVLVYNDIRSS